MLKVTLKTREGLEKDTFAFVRNAELFVIDRTGTIITTADLTPENRERVVNAVLSDGGHAAFDLEVA